MISIKKKQTYDYDIHVLVYIYKLAHGVKISTGMGKEFFFYSITLQACSPYRPLRKKKEFSHLNPAEKQYKMPVT